MARKAAPVTPVAEHIIDIDVTDEMQSSFLEYAYSVIYSRALPDARDGLKPVQRRILFGMSAMGLTPERGHVKSSRVVGDVMGKLHPHGDGAIYDALVRMAQAFSLRVRLVDGHGNFGNLDDGPAAMRYTECRLAPAAMLMTGSLDEDVVDFAPNYDDRETEPVVMPAAFPNLLVNGATGIAVGMATNMPPHNLGEVIAAARHLIDHPKATLIDLMKFVPGPDFPTGGSIAGLAGVRDAYATGKGSFKTRATVSVERVTARKTGLVITELPYTVGPEKVIDRIAELVRAKKLAGITDVTDLTDGENGLRLVVEIKNGYNPEAVLEQLYKLTPMEDSFSINNVALVEGRPRTLGLKEMLEVYIQHRFDVVRRRSQYRRKKAADRAHIVEGLLIALDAIDDVIHIIRTSKDSTEAREKLAQAFELSEIQTQHIMDMPLRRLTSLEVGKLRDELAELEATIAALTKILDNESVLKKLVSDELAQVALDHQTDRKTVLLESAGRPAESSVPLEIDDEPCRVLLSSTGLLARTSALKSDNQDDGKRARHDVIVATAPATTRGFVGAVTTLGRVVRIACVDLPNLPTTSGAPNVAGGVSASEVTALEAKERIIGLVRCPQTEDEVASAPSLALGTQQGVIKRVSPELTTKDAASIIALKPGDQVVGAVEVTSEDSEFVFITKDAQLLRSAISAVRPQGRGAAGMSGMKVSAPVIFFGVVDPTWDAEVVTVAGSSHALPGTSANSVKITDLEQFPLKGRGTSGMRCHKFLKGEDELSLGWAGTAPARAAGPRGAAADLPQEQSKRDASGSPVMNAISAVSGPA